MTPHQPATYVPKEAPFLHPSGEASSPCDEPVRRAMTSVPLVDGKVHRRSGAAGGASLSVQQHAAVRRAHADDSAHVAVHVVRAVDRGVGIPHFSRPRGPGKVAEAGIG